MSIIGAVLCKSCGNSQGIHLFDLFPSQSSGWSVKCAHCTQKQSLPFIPTIPAFLLAFATAVYAWQPISGFGERLFGQPMPFLCYALILFMAGAVGLAVNVLANSLYYRVFK